MERIDSLRVRDDSLTVWEMALDSVPSFRANDRELVWAGWKTRAQALDSTLLPHVRAYLASAGDTSVIAARREVKPTGSRIAGCAGREVESSFGMSIKRVIKTV